MSNSIVSNIAIVAREINIGGVTIRIDSRHHNYCYQGDGTPEQGCSGIDVDQKSGAMYCRRFLGKPSPTGVWELRDLILNTPEDDDIHPGREEPLLRCHACLRNEENLLGPSWGQ